jgi:hypothetical protein
MMMRLVLTIQFTFYGLIYFPVTIIVDMFTFFFNLYTQASIDSLNANSSKQFSREGLKLFEETLDDILYDLEVKKTQL